MKIIFLDFDGVLNNTKYLEAQSEIVFAPFDFVNVENLNTITDIGDIGIVITSDWRRFGLDLKQFVKRYGVIGNVVGETRVTDHMPRGMEIQAWLLKYRVDKEFIQKFVILDDRDDMGYISDRLIQTDPAVGLTKEDALRAIEMLR